MKKIDMLKIIVNSPLYEVPFWEYRGYTREGAINKYIQELNKRMRKVEVKDMYDEYENLRDGLY